MGFVALMTANVKITDFCPEDGGRRCIWIVGTYLPNHHVTYQKTSYLYVAQTAMLFYTIQSIIPLAKYHIFGSLFHTKFQHPTLNVSKPRNNTAAMLILLIYEIKNLLKLSIRGGCTLGI
jgi:hypothetical protein